MSVTTLLHPDEIDRVIERLASQVIERHDQCEGLVLLGIQRRGVDIARRLNIALENKLGHKLLECSLDICSGTKRH